MFEERKSHPFLMYDEMRKSPGILKECLQESNLKVLRRMAKEIVKRKFKKMYFVGAGTSLNMGIASSYAFNSISKMSVWPIQSFEFLNYPPADLSKETFVLALSHSGKTKVTLEAASLAKSKGATVFAMTDGEDSLLAKLAEVVSLGPGGLERCFPNTRSYVSGLLRSYMLSVMIAEEKAEKDLEEYHRQLKEVPLLTRRVFDSTEKTMISLAEQCKGRVQVFYVLGGGPNYANACEGALKFMEASIVKSCALEVEEFAHGQFIVSDENALVIVIAPPGESYDRSCDQVDGQKYLKSTTVSLVRKGDIKISKHSEKIIEIPENLDEVFTPIPYIIPLYLLAYYLAIKRGINPDILRMNEKDYLDAYNVIYQKQRPDIEIFKHYKR